MPRRKPLEKPPVAPPHPYRLKRLSRDKRLLLAQLACRKFRCPDLRKAEVVAKAELAVILERDAQTIPPADLEVLRRYGRTVSTRGFNLPYSVIYREEGERTFTRPDGKEIKREGGKTRTVERPVDDSGDLPYVYTWQQALKVRPEREGKHRYNDVASRITFKKPVELVADADVPIRVLHDVLNIQDSSRVHYGDKLTVLEINSVHTGFLSADVMPALVKYYVAADTRIREERRLIVAAIALIATCTVYGQILDFWPEASEIEDKLFAGVLPSAFSLVVLSDEDKAALCANMGQRGVQSPACQRLETPA